MGLKELDYLELPPSADMHVHLRTGEMSELVAKEIRRGGVDTVYVMVRKQPVLDTGNRLILILFSQISSRPSPLYKPHLSTNLS